MGFDANGTYTRKYGNDTWVGDAQAGTKILADRHDENDTDMAKALSDCLNRRGQGGALANISMGGFKITNLLDPVGLQDAATYNSVKNTPGWDKSKYIAGADLDGRLNFTGTSGVNGITWTYADVSWIARHSVASKYGNRLAMNNSVAPNTTGDPSGDVFFIDDSGRVNNNGTLSNNLSYDGSTWRTISPGYGSLLNYTSGDFALSSNDTATITNPYVAVTPRQFFNVNNSAGSSIVSLTKSASGKECGIRGYVGTELRWNMQLGDTTAESSTYVGSDFRLTAYSNSGASPVTRMHINRSTGNATFYGSVTSASNFDSTSTTCVVSASNGGSIHLRPNGPTATTSGLKIDSNGSVLVCDGDNTPTGGIYAGYGIRGKVGSNGIYDSEFMNFAWNGSNLVAYADTSSLGNVTVSCDYRIKKDIVPLRSTWNLVKALKPVRYTQKAYDIWTNDDTPRWGFVAHELQEALGPHAATGVKDGPEVQSPNLMGIIAGLTKALQEAMARIEALEAAA